MSAQTLDQAETHGGVTTQPYLGLASGLIVAGVFVALGILPGLELSMVVLGPITLFALPVLGASAFYWDGWPGCRLGQPMKGLANTVVIGVGGLVFTVGAVYIVSEGRLGSIFASGADSATWPWTLPLGALMFWAVLQVTLVSEKWPLQKLRPIPQGFAMLAYSGIVSVVLYLVLANWDAFPEVVEAGLRNPGGVLDGIELIGLTVTVITWTLTIFLLLGGWPFTLISSDPVRLSSANITPIVLGYATYELLTGPLALTVPQIGAIDACVVLGCFAVGLLFDPWPFGSDRPAAKRTGQLLAVALVATTAYFGLRTLGTTLETFESNPIELWVAISALNYLAAVIALYCLTWERWPLLHAHQG